MPKKINKLLGIVTALIIFFVFLLSNFVLNFKFWQELWQDSSKNNKYFTEFLLPEMSAESVRQNFINYANPFIQNENILVPFGINYSLNNSSPINGLYFLGLRPYFSAQQSLILIICLGMLLSNIGMYLLLRKMKISRAIAFLFSLSFGFSPWLAAYINTDINYVVLYPLVWFFLSAYTLFTSPTKRLKLLATLGLVFFSIFTLWTNIYFFTALLLMISAYFIYYLLTKRKTLIDAIRQNIVYLISSVLLFLLIISPWILKLIQLYKYQSLNNLTAINPAQTVGGTTDLLNFFLPSANPAYHAYTNALTEIFPFFENILANYTYPGFLILASYLLLVLFRRKIPVKLRSKLKPHFMVSVFFLLLVLGTKLQIMGISSFTLPGGGSLSIPLPLKLIPLLNKIPNPSRLMPAFLLIGSIITAHLFNYYYLKTPNKNKVRLILVLVLIFAFDHFYRLPKPELYRGPENIYRALANHEGKGAVLEIPFVLKSGLTYYGDVNLSNFVRGQTIHQKPLIGGYAKQINPIVFDYYKNHMLLGYLGRIIDLNIMQNPLIDKSDLIKGIVFDPTQAAESADFLDIQYILFNSGSMAAKIPGVGGLFHILGYKLEITDGAYQLYIRNYNPKEYLSVRPGVGNYQMFLAQGFKMNEDEARPMVNKKVSRVLFKTNSDQAKKLKFSVKAFYPHTKVTVYANQNKAGQLTLEQELKEYTIDLKQGMQSGLNSITFRFSLPRKQKLTEDYFIADFHYLTLE